MSNIKLFQEKVVANKDRFAQVAPDLQFETEVIFAIQAVNNNSALQSCTPTSLSNAVMNIGLTGLTLNPVMGHGYLIPRKGKAVFMPGYQGLVYLMISTGLVLDVYALPVYAADEFHVEMGTSRSIKHIPAHRGDENTQNNPLIKMYGVARYPNGGYHIEVMTVQEIMANAMRSDANKKAGALSGPWVTDFIEMAKKTIIRRIWKSVPKGAATSERIKNAISVLDSSETAERNVSEIIDIDFTEVSSSQTGSAGAQNFRPEPPKQP